MKKECIEHIKDFIEKVYREHIDMIKDEDVDYRSGVSAFRRELILALAKEEKKYDSEQNETNQKEEKESKKKEHKHKDNKHEKQKNEEKKTKFTSDDHSVKKFLGNTTEGFRSILRDGKI